MYSSSNAVFLVLSHEILPLGVTVSILVKTSNLVTRVGMHIFGGGAFQLYFNTLNENY